MADFWFATTPANVEPNRSYSVKLIRQQMGGPRTFNISGEDSLTPTNNTATIPGMQTEVSVGFSIGAKPGGTNPKKPIIRAEDPDAGEGVSREFTWGEGGGLE